MSEYEALATEVRRFLAGGELVALREAVEAYDAPVSASPDARFRRLDSDVWALLSEADLGERTTDGVRAELARRHPELAPAARVVTARLDTAPPGSGSPWSDVWMSVKTAVRGSHRRVSLPVTF